LEQLTKKGSRRASFAGRISPLVTIPLALGILVGMGDGRPGHGQPKRYEPDREACQVETIRRAYRANLLPWDDQPEVVRARLRQLQAAMTLDTLRDCQSQGLLSPDQVASLTAELDLAPSPASSSSSPAPGAASSPARP
jgi:hypothetical protein